MVSARNEVNNQLRRLECRNNKAEQEETKEIIKCRVDYLQKTKRTEKRKTDDEGTAVKRPKNKTERPKNKAKEVPEINTLDY